jgi:hypothetical protein
MRMKRVSILLAMAMAALLGSCADPLEKRSTDEVGAQLQRGVTGQGQIGPINREEDDTANEHAVPQTHP